MKSQSDLHYVQFQPSQDLLDVRFQMMTPAERGVYWTIKLYLYANGGKCPLDEQMLAKVAGCEGPRSQYSANGNRENFLEIWEKIKSSFVIKDSTIRHKIVSKNLRSAKKSLQAKRRAGLASAKARRALLQQCSDGVVTKKRKVKKR